MFSIFFLRMLVRFLKSSLCCFYFFEMSGKLCFLKNYTRQVVFFLQCLKEFTVKFSGPGVFFGDRFLNNMCTFLIYTDINIFFLLLSALVSCVFQRICLFHSNCKFIYRTLFLEYFNCIIHCFCC